MNAPDVCNADRLIAAVALSPHAPDPNVIYVGTGLASHRVVSTGRLPLDCLGMILVADAARRERGAKEVVHLIADDHALVNSFAAPAAVRCVADAFESRLCTAVEVLGLSSYRVIRSSELGDPLHGELLAFARARCTDPYAAREAADIEWARQRLGATVRVGWTIQPRLDAPVTGYDERYFDGVHRKLFGPSMTTIYTFAGRRLGPHPGTSPYTDEPSDRRLRLDSTAEEVDAVCSASAGMRRHLRRLGPPLAATLGLHWDQDLSTAIKRVVNAFSNRHPSIERPMQHAS